MNWTVEAFACVFVLRTIEALIACAPTLLAGLLIAAIVECLSPAGSLRAFFQRFGIAKAIGVGLLLPVCSFGVVPVALAVWRKGVGVRTVAALALSAGIAHPLFIGYGLQNVGVGVFLSLVAIGLLVNAAVAEASSRVVVIAGGRDHVERRGIAQILPAAGAMLVGRVGLYLLIGFVGCGLSAICVPPGWFGDTLFVRSAWNVPLMAAATFAAYTPPEMAIMQTRGILEMGTAPGAAVCWVLLAGGMNLAIVAFWLDQFRLRATLAMLATLLALTIGSAYAFDAIVFNGHTAAEDTHALDDHGRPFHHGDYGDGPIMATWHKLGRQLPKSPARELSLVMLGGLLVVGAVARARGTPTHVDAIPAADDARGRAVSPRMLAAVAGAFGVGIVIVAVYTYYPSAAWTYAAMQRINADMVAEARSGHAAESRANLDDLRAALTRAHVGTVLRRGVPSAAYRSASARFAAALEATDAALRTPGDDRSAAVNALVAQSRSLRAFGEAMR